MYRMGGHHTRYDGRTIEYSPAPTAGFTFMVWGTVYVYGPIAPLVRSAKREDSHFRRVLEQGDDPTIVDIVLAQDSLLKIYEQMKPVGRN
jgi:hypothetical protein